MLTWGELEVLLRNYVRKDKCRDYTLELYQYRRNEETRDNRIIFMQSKNKKVYYRINFTNRIPAIAYRLLSYITRIIIRRPLLSPRIAKCLCISIGQYDDCTNDKGYNGKYIPRALKECYYFYSAYWMNTALASKLY